MGREVKEKELRKKMLKRYLRDKGKNWRREMACHMDFCDILNYICTNLILLDIMLQ